MNAIRTALALLLAGVMQQACTTTPVAQFFALDSSPLEAVSGTSALTVALGPVDLPAYLDRPQIVTRAGGNRLVVDEFNRWGGPLYEEIDRVLAQHLAQGLGTPRVYSYPGRVVADADFRVALDIRRFDGNLGGEVVLDAAWSIIDDHTGDVVRTRRSTYQGRAAAPGYTAYAAALSGLLTQLGEELVAALRPLQPAPDQR